MKQQKITIQGALSDKVIKDDAYEKMEKVFNSPKYRGDYYDVCLCCGKQIRDIEKSRQIRQVDAGRVLCEVSEDEIPNHSGDLGWFRIGPTCYKRYIKNLQPTTITI